ncbi:hypothetical protein VTJ04DRAFT_4575 [Mycothermus thermophilus]|uniref:uncharacterized protein n=1 Tax=Humicola insolens TaxID=85995 RepID=UPI0037430A03
MRNKNRIANAQSCVCSCRCHVISFDVDRRRSYHGGALRLSCRFRCSYDHFDVFVDENNGGSRRSSASHLHRHRHHHRGCRAVFRAGSSLLKLNPGTIPQDRIFC